jgi:serine O-acetyltransferase
MVGTGAQILQYCQVGDGAILGAGAVVLEDVEPWTTVVGVPARALNS